MEKKFPNYIMAGEKNCDGVLIFKVKHDGTYSTEDEIRKHIFGEKE